jgi:hypothetical protein
VIVLRGKPRKIDLEHDYIVLFGGSTHDKELVIQTEITDSRAELTVDHFNSKRANNALSESYFWRKMTPEDKEFLECYMQE